MPAAWPSPEARGLKPEACCTRPPRAPSPGRIIPPMTNDDRKGLSRRELLGAGITTGIAAAVGDLAAPDVAAQGRAAGAAAPAADEELVFVNGRIHTMDVKD